MRMMTYGLMPFSVLLLLATFARAPAAEESKKAGVKVGDKAPAWKDLIGIDDKKHSLGDFEKAKVLVVVFTCNHCPVAVAYEDRLVEFAKAYKKKGVEVVAVNVNNLPEDKLDKMKERAAKKGFTFPYLYDPTQKIGRDFGAKVTPHCFALDSDRKVAYIGSFDDEQDPAKVKKHFLADAVDALLSGKKPPVTENRAFGCSVKYED